MAGLVGYAWAIADPGSAQGLTIVLLYSARTATACYLAWWVWAALGRIGTPLAFRHYELDARSVLVPQGRRAVRVPYEELSTVSAPANPYGLRDSWYRPFEVTWETGGGGHYRFRRRPRGVSLLELRDIICQRATQADGC